MKTKQQFHDMTIAELDAKLSSLKKDLYQLRFNHATGQLNNPNLIPMCKKDIARVLTEKSLRAAKDSKAKV